MKREEELARIVYEATRLEALWSKRSIVPEPWDERDEAFRKQMIDNVTKYMNLDELPTPEQAHNSWMNNYFKMGWNYGEKRDPVLKTHPDLVPFDELPKDEKDKDAIYLTILWVIREITKKL